MIKNIKVITGIKNWDTKVYEDGKDITENLVGIDIHLWAGKLPEVILHYYISNLEYEGEKCEVTFVNHKPKKVKGTDAILEDTNYSSCKNGRHYIKK